jgi:acyl-CoA hydrolase
LITMKADIKALGRSSIQVKITVTSENQSGDIEEICAANFTFVTMKDRKPHTHNLSFEKLLPKAE